MYRFYLSVIGTLDDASTSVLLSLILGRVSVVDDRACPVDSPPVCYLAAVFPEIADEATL